MRRIRSLIAVSAPVVVLLGAPLQSAHATTPLPTGCVQSDPTHVTCTYSAAGENPLSVSGLTSASVTATGAPGAPSASGSGAANVGGVGAVVTGAVTFALGTTLYAEVGSAGSGGSGGANGGASAFSGGGGGGASDLRTVASSAAGTLDSRLIVAAGGGGAGGLSDGSVSGGAAGQDAGPADFGGKAGTQNAGGAAGSGADSTGTDDIDADPGTQGAGGQGGYCAGGGGGGLYGGGGGNNTQAGVCGSSGTGYFAGGGGGGSSLVPSGGTSVLAADTTVTPQVVVEYVNNMISSVGATSTEATFPAKPTFSVSGLSTAETGTVTFTDHATSSLLCTAQAPSGTCTPSQPLTAGTHAIDVAYSGNDVYLPSNASINSTIDPQVKPTITATVTSAHQKTKYGWYRSPVTVHFTCTAGTAPLSSACPAPVTVSSNVKGDTFTRTVTATDGATGTVKVGPLNLDRTKPTVKVTGPKADRAYGSSGPKAACTGTDKLSGLAACKVTVTKLSGGRRRVTAVATDRAGNTASANVTYLTAAFLVRSVIVSKGDFVVHRGHHYTVEVDSSTKPTYYYAEPVTGKHSKPFLVGPQMTKSAKGVWTLRISITSSMRSYRHWDIGAKFGGKLHVVQLDVRA
jgi:hypothetical protein